MRFEDRITFNSQAAWERKWHRYWTHLSEQGFKLADPVYRHFAGDVFHDGELLVRSVDLTQGTVVLQLRNVHAINEITAGEAYRAKRFPIERSDFQTTVSFNGVGRFHVRTKPSIRTRSIARRN